MLKTTVFLLATLSLWAAPNAEAQGRLQRQDRLQLRELLELRDADHERGRRAAPAELEQHRSIRLRGAERRFDIGDRRRATSRKTRSDAMKLREPELERGDRLRDLRQRAAAFEDARSGFDRRDRGGARAGQGAGKRGQCRGKGDSGRSDSGRRDVRERRGEGRQRMKASERRSDRERIRRA